MEYRTLGRTGVQVSTLCLGAMMFGAWGNPDHDDSIRIIHRALDAGINFIDTADVYSAGESEEIVGKALAAAAATTSCSPRSSSGRWASDPNRRGDSRRWIVREVEDTLRRLGTDWIDLYQVHRPEPGHRRRRDPRRAHRPRPARARSATSAPRRSPPSRSSRRSGSRASARLQRFVTEQPPYSILVRGIEADVLPTCRRYGMGVITWSPLAGGWLSGPLPQGRRSPTAPSPRSGWPTATTCRCPRTSASSTRSSSSRKLAEEAGITLIELAIAFVVNHPAVTAAIIGPRTMEQLDSQLAAADVDARRRVLDRIDEIVPPGINLNPADTSYGEQVLMPALRRR